MNQPNTKNYLEKKDNRLLYLIAWTVLGLSLIEPVLFGGYLSQNMLSKLSSFQIAFAVIIVALIVRKTERVYWITSVTFEETKSMKRRMRTTLAEAVARIIVIHMVILIIYTTIAAFFDAKSMVDLIVFGVITLLTVISVMVAVQNITKPN